MQWDQSLPRGALRSDGAGETVAAALPSPRCLVALPGQKAKDVSTQAGIPVIELGPRRLDPRRRRRLFAAAAARERPPPYKGPERAKRARQRRSCCRPRRHRSRDLTSAGCTSAAGAAPMKFTKVRTVPRQAPCRARHAPRTPCRAPLVCIRPVLTDRARPSLVLTRRPQATWASTMLSTTSEVRRNITPMVPAAVWPSVFGNAQGGSIGERPQTRHHMALRGAGNLDEPVEPPTRRAAARCLTSCASCAAAASLPHARRSGSQR